MSAALPTTMPKRKAATAQRGHSTKRHLAGSDDALVTLHVSPQDAPVIDWESDGSLLEQFISPMSRDEVCAFCICVVRHPVHLDTCMVVRVLVFTLSL